jgi:hypothetical protein
MTEKIQYKHGDVLPTGFVGIPEQYCGPNQYILIVPGVGCVVQDHTEQSRRDDERAGVIRRG